MNNLLHKFEDDGIVLTTVDHLLNLTRANSLFFMLFGLACCGIAMMQSGRPRDDM